MFRNDSKLQERADEPEVIVVSFRDKDGGPPVTGLAHQQNFVDGMGRGDVELGDEVVEVGQLNLPLEN